MPAFIRHTHNIDLKVCETEWNLQTPPPLIRPERIIEIQADGAELEKILDLFNGLLGREHREYTRWEDSLARIVYERVLAKLGSRETM